jgi:hypothetical protein
MRAAFAMALFNALTQTAIASSLPNRVDEPFAQDSARPAV